LVRVLVTGAIGQSIGIGIGQIDTISTVSITGAIGQSIGIGIGQIDTISTVSITGIITHSIGIGIVQIDTIGVIEDNIARDDAMCDIFQVDPGTRKHICAREIAVADREIDCCVGDVDTMTSRSCTIYVQSIDDEWFFS